MGSAATSYPHIVCDPQTCGGRPTVEGTRLSVAAIVAYHLQGCDFDEILAQFPQVSPAGLHAALLYYLDHRSEIEADLERSQIAPDGARIVRV